MTDTLTDRDGLPAGQALAVSGALVSGLAIMHFLVGTPQGPGDWLVLVSTAIVSPALGYLLVTQEFGRAFGVLFLVFVVNMLAATM